jgi:hypothetical protein
MKICVNLTHNEAIVNTVDIVRKSWNQLRGLVLREFLSDENDVVQREKL